MFLSSRSLFLCVGIFPILLFTKLTFTQAFSRDIHILLWGLFWLSTWGLHVFPFGMHFGQLKVSGGFPLLLSSLLVTVLVGMYLFWWMAMKGWECLCWVGEVLPLAGFNASNLVTSSAASCTALTSLFVKWQCSNLLSICAFHCSLGMVWGCVWSTSLCSWVWITRWWCVWWCDLG